MSNKVEQFSKIVSKIERLEESIERIASKLYVDEKDSSGDGSRIRKRNWNGSNGSNQSKKRQKRAYRQLDVTSVYQEGRSSLGQISSLDMLAKVVLLREDDDRAEEQQDDFQDKEYSAEYVSELFPSPFANNNELPFVHHGSMNRFGIVSSYTLLSPKGLEFLKSKCLNSDVELGQLSEWYSTVFQSKSMANFAIPVCLRDLPTGDILEKLLKVYANSGAPIMSVFSCQLTTEIYAKYVSQGMSDMKAAESMVLNVILALSCLIIRQGLIDDEQISIISLGLTPQEMKVYEDTFISNALYLTHRVTVIPDGLLSIQALLCLITYTCLSGAIHASYLLMCIMARLSQDMGLHTESLLHGLTPQQKYNRRSLWWLCRYFDLKLSVTLGKPPAIADFDSTTNIPSVNKKVDLLEMVILGSSKKYNNYDAEFADNIYQTILKTDGFLPVARHYIFRLCGITSRIYERLCNNTIHQTQTVQHKAIRKAIDELETFRLSLPKDLNPGQKFVGDITTAPHEHMSTKSIAWLIYEIQLNYLVNMMFVHRSLFKVETRLKSKGKIDYEPEYKSIESARDILNCVINMDSTFVTIIMRSKPWSFVLAFFDIFLYSITGQEDKDIIESDVKLLLQFHNKICEGLLIQPYSVGSYFFDIKLENGCDVLHVRNMLFIFKCLTSILRNTLEAKTGRKLFPSGEDKLLQCDPESHDLKNLIPSNDIMNPFNYSNLGFEAPSEGFDF